MVAESSKKKSSLTIMTKKSNAFDLFYLNILGMISILISLIMKTNTNTIYQNAFIIPMITGLMYFMSSLIVKNLKYNLINIMIYFLYFIRNSLTLLFLSITDYSTRYHFLNSQLIDKAVILMVLDTVLVFFFLMQIDNKPKIGKLTLWAQKNKLLNIFLIVSLLFCLIAYLTVPEINNGYVSIFTSDLSSAVTEIPSGFVGLMIYRIFILVFPMIQLLLPIKLIVLIKNKLGNRLIGVFLSLCLSTLPLTFVSTTVAYSLIVVAAILLTILELFPRYRNILFVFIGTSIVGGLVFFFWAKITEGTYDHSLETVASFLQAYFPGIINIAVAFTIPTGLIKPKILVNDFLGMWPLINTLFPEWQVYNNSTSLFLAATNYPGQIMPNLSMAYLYIGIFAPIVNILLFYIANKFYKAKRQNVYQFACYTLAALYFGISPIMYNYAILGNTFFNNIFWLLLFTRFISK